MQPQYSLQDNRSNSPPVLLLSVELPDYEGSEADIMCMVQDRGDSTFFTLTVACLYELAALQLPCLVDAARSSAQYDGSAGSLKISFGPHQGRVHRRRTGSWRIRVAAAAATSRDASSSAAGSSAAGAAARSELLGKRLRLGGKPAAVNHAAPRAAQPNVAARAQRNVAAPTASPKLQAPGVVGVDVEALDRLLPKGWVILSALIAKSNWEEELDDLQEKRHPTLFLLKLDGTWHQAMLDTKLGRRQITKLQPPHVGARFKMQLTPAHPGPIFDPSQLIYHALDVQRMIFMNRNYGGIEAPDGSWVMCRELADCSYCKGRRSGDKDLGTVILPAGRACTGKHLRNSVEQAFRSSAGTDDFPLCPTRQRFHHQCLLEAYPQLLNDSPLADEWQSVCAYCAEEVEGLGLISA